MKKIRINITLFFLLILWSCAPSIVEDLKGNESVIPNVLPFKALKLSDMSEFQSTTQNWSVMGNVHSDFTQKLHIKTREGTGILVNQPTSKNRDPIFSTFEHGDIELDLEFMMPKGSNSGIYFQSRYEIQLLDSWEVNNLTSRIVGVSMSDGMIKNQKDNKAMRGMLPKRM